MINTVFGFGNIPESDKEFVPFIGNSLEQQYEIGVSLLIMVIILIPIMLLSKPCLFRDKPRPVPEEEIELQPNDRRDQYAAIKDDDSITVRGEQNMKSIEEKLEALGKRPNGETFGEAFIHQVIETIEFVLGTVSNTASYLRLWALSLAHSQLSETFFNLIFKYTFHFGNLGYTILVGVLLWPVFWTVTFGVLLCMDLLECALHTLRLHWVEFQNKFYKGEGYAFAPLNYKAIFTEVLEK